jgi:peptide/nickel transport system ATP-binding protein
VIPGMVASLGEHVHGCRFCQRMGIAASELRERPALIEITPGYWVENCERCYQP